MPINYESVTSGANPSADSLLIPFGDLYGLTDSTELGNSTEEDDGKISASVNLTMADKINALSNPLGVNIAKPNPTGAGNDIFRQNVAVTWNYVIDFDNQEVTVYPIVGGSSKSVAFTDVFPNAEILATADTATADSLAIPIADLTARNADITVANKQGSLGDDQREMLEAMTRLVFTNANVRSASQSSAVQAKTRSNVQGSGVPNNFFTDTTFSEADQSKLGWFTTNYSMTHEYQLNQDTQQFDVNVVTS
jgi:hypothetical protein